MKFRSIFSIFAGALFFVGCAPSADVSGWEVAQKRSDGEGMPSFPELPVVLPPTPEAPPTPPSESGMQAVVSQKLDPGSLFRRGYSVPTP